MSTNAPGVLDPVLQAFVDKMIAVVVRKDGTFPADPPDSFRDRLQNPVVPSGGQFRIELNTSEDGTDATVRITAIGDSRGSLCIEGAVDLTRLGALVS